MDIGDKVYHSLFGKIWFIILDKRNSIGSNDLSKYDYLININSKEEWVNGGNLIRLVNSSLFNAKIYNIWYN